MDQSLCQGEEMHEVARSELCVHLWRAGGWNPKGNSGLCSSKKLQWNPGKHKQKMSAKAGEPIMLSD